MLAYGTYADSTTLKARLAISDTTDDLILRQALEDASRFIDEYCHRRFYVWTETRYYTAKHLSHLILNDCDLLAIATLKTDEDGDRTYETTWAITDYDLEPFNEWPKWRLSTTPEGDYSFPTTVKGIEIAGTWGYGDGNGATPYVSSGGTVTVATAAGTAVTASSGALFAVGQTILAGTEQMYITAIATNTLTCVRGVNGTTAAIQAAAVAYIYRYPDSVRDACLTLAAESYAMRGAPMGVSGGGDMGDIRLRPSVWARVASRLSPYRHLAVG